MSQQEKGMDILIYIPTLIDKLTFEYQPANYAHRSTDIHRKTNENLNYVD